MKINAIFYSIIFLLLVLSTNKSVAQSLKGKTWQSQDTTSLTFKPKTLVINRDGTFYQIGYFYLSPEVIYPINSESFNGKYTQTKDDLKLTSFLNGHPVREWQYKIIWTNSQQFTLVDGNKKYSYAELGSAADYFSKKRMISYLKKTISKGEPYDSCYKVLVFLLNVDTVQLKEEYKIRRESLEKKVEPAKFYSSFKGKTFIYNSGGRITTYRFGNDGTFKYRDEVNNAGCLESFESHGQFTSDKNTIHFKSESYIEITGCGTITRNRNEINEYDKEVVWVNDYMFRMKFGNLTYLFTAQK
jgi:hypothetical protein